MKSTILITPTDNIKNNAVIDNSKVTKRVYDSLMDVLLLRNVKTNERRRSNLMGVSLYDDVIVENVEYKILQMLTK